MKKIDKHIENKKGDENMECVLENKSISNKLSDLKNRAKLVKEDKNLRHTLSQHDIVLSTENTKLLFSHQTKTIRRED